jgi:DNA-binding NtrC family response regulator
LRGEEAGSRSGLPDGLTLGAMEKLLIRDTLQRHGGNRAAAARALGINSSTLFRKIKALKLEKTGKARTAR